jgi:hypothetical protein
VRDLNVPVDRRVGESFRSSPDALPGCRDGDESARDRLRRLEPFLCRESGNGHQADDDDLCVNAEDAERVGRGDISEERHRGRSRRARPPQRQRDRHLGTKAQGEKFVACMRAHGEPGVGDPNSQGGIEVTKTNPASPAF